METEDVRNVGYRFSAKVVGFCDTACSCAAVIGYIYYALALTVFAGAVEIIDSMSKHSNSKFERDPDTGEGTFKWSYTGNNDSSTRTGVTDQFVAYVWASTAIDLIVTVVQIGLAIMLINATSTGRTPRSSQKWVKLYIFFNGGVLLVYFVWRIVDQNWAGLVLWGLLRFAFLIIAGLFLGKLRHITMVNQQSKAEAGKEHGMATTGNKA